MPVVLVLKVPRDTDVPVAPEQLLDVTPEVPVQNVRVSSTVADTLIRFDVEAATTPVSTAVV